MCGCLPDMSASAASREWLSRHQQHRMSPRGLCHEVSDLTDVARALEPVLEPSVQCRLHFVSHLVSAAQRRNLISEAQQPLHV
mmetsp:Transcript_17226/g.44209  ORF Transcript_17226/g.44209 Transcript_17226/m.44209 type:complete len:83 (-) Transcript_17226:160-408(-)